MTAPASTAKHTPGPWFQGSGDYQYCVYDKRVWINPDGSRGGETPNLVVVISPEDAVADARLIASAPELLEACAAMIEWDDREKDHAVDFAARMALCAAAFDKARAAIAKATGSKA